MLERAAGGEHRVEHEHRAAVELVGHRVHVGLGHERLLVAGHADEAGVGLGEVAEHAAEHAEPGPQHRHHQRRSAHPRAGGRAHRRLDVDRLDLDVACGLVDEDAGQVVHGPPEPGPVGAGLAEPGEELGGERVVDDGDLHGGMMAADGPRARLAAHDRPHAPRAGGHDRATSIALCEEATDLGVAAVCVSPSHLPITDGPRASGIGIATVIGFPSGAHQPAVKAHEAEVAVDAGATELDMVVNLGPGEGGRVVGRRRRHRAPCASTPDARAAEGDPRDGLPHRRRDRRGVPRGRSAPAPTT